TVAGVAAGEVGVRGVPAVGAREVVRQVERVGLDGVPHDRSSLPVWWVVYQRVERETGWPAKAAGRELSGGGGGGRRGRRRRAGGGRRGRRRRAWHGPGRGPRGCRRSLRTLRLLPSADTLKGAT